MATVCGSSLALMDAGVPLKRPVAGIAMGLIKEDRGFAVLSDILGDEDHLGDMDFKVAGTEQRRHRAADGHQDHLHHAGDHADRAGSGADGRLHILGEMAKALTGARGDVAATAPRITDHQRAEGEDPRGDRHRRQGDPRDRRADRLQDRHRRRRHDQDRRDRCRLQAQQAIDWIRGIVAEPEIGVIYNGKVVKTADFGAFVNFLGSRDGLVHISELQQGRVGKTTDVVNVGDPVKVKVIGFDERGKVKLSMRVVDQATGEDITEKVGAKPGRGDRDRDRERRERGERRERREAEVTAGALPSRRAIGEQRAPLSRMTPPVAAGDRRAPKAVHGCVIRPLRQADWP